MMNISIEINGRTYEICGERPLDISIPLMFNGAQPNAYGVEKASSVPCRAGTLVGDTREGGSCNFEQYTFIPHCTGTHTECVGHITNERISVRDCLQDVFMTAVLISVEPESVRETGDTYASEPDENDRLITQKSLEIQNPKSKIRNPSALVVRTLPNDDGKLTKEYGAYVPPYFSNEALEYIVAAGIRHLLVDLPSIDRIFDAGKLSNHRKFWKIADGKFETNEKSRTDATITEFIYVPAAFEDGVYLLNLQIAPFASDAAPSRPVLFKVSGER
jgi:arylformamidase